MNAAVADEIECDPRLHAWSTSNFQWCNHPKASEARHPWRRYGMRVVFTAVVALIGVGVASGAGLVRQTLPTSMTYREGGSGSSVLRDPIRLQEVYSSHYFPQHPI